MHPELLVLGESAVEQSLQLAGVLAGQAEMAEASAAEALADAEVAATLVEAEAAASTAEENALDELRERALEGHVLRVAELERLKHAERTAENELDARLRSGDVEDLEEDEWQFLEAREARQMDSIFETVGHGHVLTGEEIERLRLADAAALEAVHVRVRPPRFE